MKETRSKKPFLETLFELETKSQGAKRIGIRVFRCLIHMFNEFVQDEGLLRASGLAYVCLLGLIPLLAVGFSIFSSFGAFAQFQDNLRNFLLNHLIPSSTDQVIEYINKFIENTKTLNLINIVSLLIVAVFIFNSIEGAFNRIWEVQKQRSIIIKFVVFSVVLVWGPVLIGASIYIGGKIKATLHIAERLNEKISFLNHFFLVLLPVLLNSVALFIAYLVIPNTKVKVIPALVAGIIAGILFEFAKSGFNIYVARMITYKTLYGSLALIPFFLVWLYVSWLIVLFGAEIAFTLQNLDALMAERILSQPMANRTRLLISLKILKDATQKLDSGETLNLGKLAELLKIPFSILKEIANSLASAGFLRYTNEEEATLAITPDKILLSDAIISINRGLVGSNFELPSSDELEKIVLETENSIRERFGSISLAQWARDKK